MKQLPRLHAVTNDDILALPDFLERAARLRDAALHLRARATPAVLLYELAESLRSVVPCLIVNDRADLALAVHAEGVHLRGDSLSIEQVRRIVGREMMVGASVHSVAEARQAEARGANYLFLGSIFETRSHPGVAPLGLGQLESAVQAVQIPVIAIGGIDRQRAAQCRAVGAYGVAAIRAVWEGDWFDGND